ncbi:hypothetical protein ACFFLS_09925 [Flavobacterium procerum]|uniref:Lipoprotein n=1 Tax=Flavobacterium procerum TaxID=1455569 RepID=A0ABV6BRT8_9FLAO
MKKVLAIIVIFTLVSCKKEKESYKINNIDYITKTDSVNIQVVNKDTLKFYYLKNKLRSVTINDFVEPEYDTVKDDPFYFKTIYFINENNEFNAVLIELNNVKLIRDFKQNAEFEFHGDVWQNRGTLEDYFYDSELLNLDIALTKINNYDFPKSVLNTSNGNSLDLVINQNKEIVLYDVNSLKIIKNKIYNKFPFVYLRDIKVIKEGKENRILAKIKDRGDEVTYYINLKDIAVDVIPAD